MSIEPDDATIEKFARALIIGFKGDPDMTVQPGTPQVYGTPSGDVFAVSTGAGVPLWRMYKTTARTMLELARKIDAPVEGVTEAELSAQLSALQINQPAKVA